MQPFKILVSLKGREERKRGRDAQRKGKKRKGGRVGLVLRLTFFSREKKRERGKGKGATSNFWGPLYSRKREGGRGNCLLKLPLVSSPANQKKGGGRF